MKTVTYDETQWKLVPLDITQEMRNAWDSAHDHYENDDLNVWAAYDAMLRAAPPYPESNCKEILDSWIPVSERLPEIFQKVYAFVPLRDSTRPFSTAIMRYSNSYKSEGNRFLLDGIELEDGLVTHWMPLPSAPNLEE